MRLYVRKVLKYFCYVVLITKICSYIYQITTSCKTHEDCLPTIITEEMGKITNNTHYSTSTNRRSDKQHPGAVTDNYRKKLASSDDSFLIHTPTCKIPDYDPFDSSIRKFIIKRSENITCEEKTPLLYKKDHWLHLNEKAVKEYNIKNTEDISCCYRKFERNQNPQKYHIYADNKYSKGSKCIAFKCPFMVPENEEFISVRCTHNYGIIYENAYAFVPTNPGVQEKLLRQSWKTSNKRLSHRPLSVLLIGVDSVSRLNYFRIFKKTSKFLRDRDIIELQGFVKVGDNTFVNIIPEMTGYSAEKLTSKCWPDPKNEFDDCPFVWNEFSDKDYITSMGEDNPEIGTFNYKKTGFINQPTDYYMRPYFDYCTKELSAITVENISFVCSGDQLATIRILDHAKQFAIKFNDTPHFGFYWTNMLTHETLSLAYHSDEPYLEFFQHLFRTPELLNNTVLFFFSDHGLRYGPMRETHLGWLEERMPFFNVWLPPWFHKIYPHAISNLKKNAKRLTCPFDLYQTLLQVVQNNYDGEYSKMLPSGQVAYSLFDSVPLTRRCEDAGIDKHWCTCRASKDVPTTDANVQKAVDYTLNLLNTHLIDFQDTCATLQLDKIISSVLIEQDVTDEVTSQEYRIIFRGLPAYPVFEVSVGVSVNGKVIELLGPVSRIDKYSDICCCVDDYVLEKYCMCKKLIVNVTRIAT